MLYSGYKIIPKIKMQKKFAFVSFMVRRALLNHCVYEQNNVNHIIIIIISYLFNESKLDKPNNNT
jgi:hypothetical protein